MSMIDSGKELLPSLQPTPTVDDDPHRLWRLLRRVVIFILTLVITFLGLTAVTFCIGRFIPVDPVLAIVGDMPVTKPMRPRVWPSVSTGLFRCNT